MGNYPEQVTAADFASRVAEVRAHLASWSKATQDAVDAEDDDILKRAEDLLDEVLVVTSFRTKSSFHEV